MGTWASTNHVWAWRKGQLHAWVLSFGSMLASLADRARFSGVGYGFCGRCPLLRGAAGRGTGSQCALDGIADGRASHDGNRLE